MYFVFNNIKHKIHYQFDFTITILYVYIQKG